MNPDTPFTTIGDEPVEARIVAWVLGEASAFEAAELERLCEERPELMIFKRRMFALHGLLAEAENPQADESWKLSEDKRKAVEEIFGEETPVRPDLVKEKRIGRSGRRAFLAIAACLILTFIVAGLLAPAGMRMRKKSDLSEARSNALQRQLVLVDSEPRTQRLESSLPKELIEGTPKPMNVPDLEAPADSPAGSATWAARERGAVAEMAPELRPKPQLAAKPTAPSSSMAMVTAANTAPETSVPVPELDVTAPSLDFGDAADFGASWGGVAGGGGGYAYDSRRAAKEDGEKPVSEGVSLARDSGMDAAKDSFSDTSGSEIAKLDGPLRTNPALTYEHTQNVDQVRRDLYEAEGNFNLGKFDDAKREYEDVLRKDPYNKAARRGMEKIAAAKSDYYRAAYDHTRAELLAEVDKAWESAVPAEAKEIDGFINYGAPIAGNKKDLSIPDDAVALAKAVRDQEDKVEERRKVLSTIVRTKGIIYKGQDSFYQTGGVDEDQGARSALEVHHELEQEKLQLESQIGSLLKYDSDQLMVYAAGLDLPDNIIRNLYPQYQEAKRKLDADKAKGMGDKHPTVQATVDQVDAMKRQLDEGVINLRATLQAQLELATNRLKSVEAMKDKTREEAIKRGLDAQDYADAKREFEKDLELLQKMKLKLMASSMKAKPEAPKVDPTKLMDEIAASEEPYSTFSLNISDASFRIAQAAMDKGERPDPAGVKVEQFYNAVDYGDPAPAAGEPVFCEIEQAAHPVIPGRNLVRVALKTAAAGRSATQPLQLTLLVDQSGSMTRADRRAAMDAAMASLGKLLTKSDVVNIVGFSRTSRLVADGMKGDEAGKKLAALVNQSASEGGTNLEAAIDLAGQMAQRRILAGAQNRIVLFTDGAANLGDADPQRLAAKVERLRQQGVAFDIAGIAADGLNDELLGELARKGNGRYYVVGKGAEEDFAKQLAGAFRPAAENVKVQVRFNPERVSRYKLIGFEKDRLKTEDFRNDKVDAAELAAEEAGVAIYQIEPNPNGNGEIGEVSVRFRDTASGEMVERGWTIPHDAAAPAIDRATPSMQLATLAMFAAEKLKGGPLGEAIDFRQFAEAQANVKRFFGGNARVAEVLRMVEMLK